MSGLDIAALVVLFILVCLVAAVIVALGSLPGTYDSHGTPVTPDSLYEAQLAERTAYANLDYREYWLGDIDGFTGNDDSSVDDGVVDSGWLAAMPGSTVGFDDLQNDRWVPFSFDVGLLSSDQLVGATLALGMQNTGGTSSDDRIYLESTAQSLLFPGGCGIYGFPVCLSTPFPGTTDRIDPEFIFRSPDPTIRDLA